VSDELLTKVLGSIVGATIGDSIGAVVEFCDRETARRRLDGKEWVENMHSSKETRAGPLGVFRENPPRGTGTDDTRLNQIFVECVVKNQGFINSQLLAMEYIDRYRDTKRHYPRTPELAKKHMSHFYPVCCAHLGMRDIEDFKGEKHAIYLDEMNSFPMLSGLLSLQSAGLLFQNDPERAYRKTVELDFFDIGYARDATALLAAIVSTALSNEQLDAREIIDTGIKTNPYQLGGSNGELRTMTGIDVLYRHGPSLPRLFKSVEGARNDRDAVLALARECEYVHPFSPLDILGVPMAIIRHTNGDPFRSIIMAANHRRVDKDGNLVQLRDVDCVAMITGVLAGAISGVDAFPKDWVKDALSANLDVYGFDIEKNAEDFYQTVFRRTRY